MSISNLRRGYGRDEAGSTAVEFALVSIVFLTLMFGIIDAARFAWEFNSAKAAARAGARFAAVSPPVVQQLVAYDAIGSLGLAGGSTLPTDGVAIPDYSCNSTTCTSSGTRVAANFTSIVTRMQQYYPKVQAGNVTITYRERGLGVAGNPFGTDVQPLITVGITGLTFRPMALRIFGVTLTLPSVETTFSGEDLA
jgi:Flp pilus assembly protein TadG